MAKQETTDLAKKGPIADLRGYLDTPKVQARLNELVKDEKESFISTIIQVTRGSQQLQRCTKESIVAAGITAAGFKLSVDPALGQAAIVPYGKDANFQLMYRGVIQLCMRSGAYKSIHLTEVYSDELDYWNPITGEILFKPLEEYKLREKGDIKDVVGHYCTFTLNAGFQKCDYITHAQALAHAKRYSKAYQYDLNKKSKTSAWTTDPIRMGNKTVLLKLLKMFGIMSVEMRKALIHDASFEKAMADSDAVINGSTGKLEVDADLTGEGKKTRKKVESKDTTAKTEPTPDEKTEAQDAGIGYLWKCLQCEADFDDPKEGDGGVMECPECGDTNIESQE